LSVFTFLAEESAASPWWGQWALTGLTALLVALLGAFLGRYLPYSLKRNKLEAESRLKRQHAREERELRVRQQVATEWEEHSRQQRGLISTLQQRVETLEREMRECQKANVECEAKAARLEGEVNLVRAQMDRMASSMPGLPSSSWADAGLEVDQGGIIQSWNPGASNLFGWTHVEAIGRPIWELIPDEIQPVYREMLAEVAAAGGSLKHENPYFLFGKRKDGETIPVEVSVSDLGLVYGKRHYAVVCRRRLVRPDASAVEGPFDPKNPPRSTQPSLKEQAAEALRQSMPKPEEPCEDTVTVKEDVHKEVRFRRPNGNPDGREPDR
jgi:PAS domain S-box-containing protein